MTPEQLQKKIEELEVKVKNLEAGIFGNVGEEQIRNIVIDRLQSTNAEALAGYFMMYYKGKLYKVGHYGN